MTTRYQCPAESWVRDRKDVYWPSLYQNHALWHPPGALLHDRDRQARQDRRNRRKFSALCQDLVPERTAALIVNRAQNIESISPQ